MRYAGLPVMGDRVVAINGGIAKVEDDRWKPPNQGGLKINCDGRVDKRRRRVGLGVVVRDEGGRVLRCWAQGSEATYDLECAKAMAIYRAVLVGRQMGLGNFVVESDADSVIKQFLIGSFFDKAHGGILEAIQSLVPVDVNVNVRAISHKANIVARKLANEALNFKEEAVWEEDAPLCIRDLVVNEQGC